MTIQLLMIAFLLVLLLLWRLAWRNQPMLAVGIGIGVILGGVIGAIVGAPTLESVPIWLPPLPFAIVAFTLFFFGILAWFWGDDRAGGAREGSAPKDSEGRPEAPAAH